ncbi:MAG: hypothetical protein FWD76_04815 [Firmicutes bacterium]|nr:hypothetical protein [Bacillota bacterium]
MKYRTINNVSSIRIPTPNGNLVVDSNQVSLQVRSQGTHSCCPCDCVSHQCQRCCHGCKACSCGCIRCKVWVVLGALSRK